MIVSTTIEFYRHAHSTKNDPAIVGGRSQGATLSAEGRGQALQLNAYLLRQRRPFAALYTSQAIRAIQTATSATRGLNIPSIIELAGLNELSQGVLEGKPRLANFVPMTNRDPDYRAEKGQSIREVGHDMQNALRHIGDQHPNSTVMVVGHAIALRCFLTDLEGYNPTTIRATIQRIFSKKVPYCSQTTFIYKKGRFTVAECAVPTIKV